MTLFAQVVTILTFVSLLYEIVFIPVPSIASTYQLFFPETPTEVEDKGILSKVQRWPLPLKGLFLLLPTAFVVTIYLLPLAQAISPATTSYLHPIIWLRDPTIVVVGAAIAIGGRLIGLQAAYAVYKSDRSDQAHAATLQRTGMFSRSRNPILLSMLIAFIGLLLVYPSWEQAIGFFFFAANMHFRVLLEESFLIGRFGNQYKSFMNQTRRYL